MRLLDEPFEKIQSGKKKIEVRLNDSKRQKLNSGDIIEFSKRTNMDQKLTCKIIKLHNYKSLEELSKNIDLQKLGLENCSKKDFLEKMNLIYSKDKKKEFGVLGIEIELKECT